MLALHQNVLKTGGPIYFVSSQPIPLYLAFCLYFYTTSLSANIKEPDLQPLGVGYFETLICHLSEPAF